MSDNHRFARGQEPFRPPVVLLPVPTVVQVVLRLHRFGLPRPIRSAHLGSDLESIGAYSSRVGGKIFHN